MSRPSPPRPWHPMPGFDHGPPPDWYKRQEQQQLRGRSPPRSYSPGSHLQQRQHSPRGEHKRSLSPRNERSSSPRNEQQSNRRISPIRAPSPSRERLGSPRRDHPPSPGRERYSPRREKPLSPPRERPRSPYGWRPRSPPRQYYDWRPRSRSPPPPWMRRSPPRFGPLPSGRSPPRGPWHHPAEWDRYHRPYPDRRSPPRYGPSPGPPPPHWDRRWAPPSMHSGPPPADRYPPSRSNSKSSPPPPADAKPYSRGEDALLPADDKEEEIDSFDLGPYDPDIAVGQKYVIPVSGFFCKVCHKFYNSESSAKITHCKTKTHYDKFAKWLSEKKVAALVKKRALRDETKPAEEPAAKQIKLEPTEEKTATETETKYDPTQPTTDAAAEEAAVNSKPVEQESAKDMQTENEEIDRNGSRIEQTTDDAESDALITNETKKDVGGDYIEATLFNLRKLKVNQLKANLEKRGMKSTGLKPLLLKRLEKVLAEEAAIASTESIAEEETKKEQLGDGDESDVEKEYLIKMMESDVEPANRKSQWLTEQELERELLQLEKVKKIVEIRSERSRVFNGRRTNVEWSVKLLYSGIFPEDGLQFSLSSHQQLPFVAMVLEDE